MSGALSQFCNRGFMEQLCQLEDMNVLLLMIDGSAAFGRIASSSGNKRILRLVQPVGVTFPVGVTNGVVFRPANPDLAAPIILAQAWIDVCDIAFVFWGTFPTIPLFTVALGAFQSGSGSSAGNASTTANAGTRIEEERQGFNFGFNNNGINQGALCALIEELRELTVRNVSLVTLGGWTVTGQLGQVFDCVALINPATATIPFVATIGTISISGPAIPGGALIIPAPVSAWVNLATLTQILQP